MHIPVLLDAVLQFLLPAEAELCHQARAIDGTLGAGGHSAALLRGGVGELLGLDLDPAALEIARAALAPYGERAHLAHASYLHMADEAQKLGWDSADIILLDLGLSSMQLDTPARGFSFRHDAPLDMRFNPAGETTAAFLVNTLAEDELADLFYHYGEERESRRLARAVVRARPLETTGALAATIEAVSPRRPGDKIHPATRVFQALRIAVNDELQAVERALPIALDLLKPGGRLGVISFHSLEDRIVKDTFKLASTDCICPPHIPQCVCGHQASARLVTRKPVVADDAEAAANPRSRSAKLRVVEKLTVDS
jgi:16S rRNA (cytosine1402-N4)-methyltransferase